MPQVSKYPVSKDVYERIFDIFLKTIVELKTKRQVSEFLEEFLTPTEQIMLAKRLSVAFLLAKGYDYREISKILRVSTNTVGTVAIAYRYGENYRKFVERILKDEEIGEFFEGVGEFITGLLSSGRSKSGAWRYLNEEIRTKRKKKVF